MPTDTSERGAHRPLPTRPTSALTGGTVRRARSIRRLGISGLVLLIGLGMAGVLGQRTSTVTASGGGYRMTVTYPSVVRPGLDVRWDIAVSRPAGFGRSLSIAVSRHYLDLFDLNSVRPDADSVTSTGDAIVYTWDAPPGAAFVLSMDAYAEYGEHLGLDGFSSVMVGGRPVLTVRYHTRWVP